MCNFIFTILRTILKVLITPAILILLAVVAIAFPIAGLFICKTCEEYAEDMPWIFKEVLKDLKEFYWS